MQQPPLGRRRSAIVQERRYVGHLNQQVVEEWTGWLRRVAEGTLFDQPLILLHRIGGDALPSSSSIRGSSRADRLPAVCRVAGGVPEVPTARSRRQSDPLAALRHSLLPRKGFHGLPVGLERALQSSSKPGVGMHLGSGPPFAEELAQRRVVVELSGGRDHPGEL